MKRILAVVLASACIPALADLIPIGPPEDTGSWQQRFGESDTGAFDLLAVRMASDGDSFKSPAHNDFSESDWSIALDGSDLASAWGDSVSSLGWDIHFEGDLSNPLVFDYVTFSGADIVNAARAEWSGNGRAGWSITPFPGGIGAFWVPDNPPVPIPVPGAVLLGAVGLVGLWWIKRRHAV